MGKIKGWSITPEGGHREVYRPGETVCGTVTLTVEGEIKVKDVKIYCVGMAMTKMARTRFSESVTTSIETYINNIICSGPKVLTSGSYSYNYSFQLPSDGVPSSFEGALGYIRYYLRVEVNKAFPGINDNFYQGFTVLAHIDVNEEVYKNEICASGQKELSKAFGFGDAGTLSLSASLDRNGYCPGEKVTYFMKISVEVPLGLDLELKIPLKIGTVPLGMSIPSMAKLTRPGYYEVERSKAITYVKCLAGIQRFYDSVLDSLSLPYIPMTAFNKINLPQNVPLPGVLPQQISNCTQQATGAISNSGATPTPEKSATVFAPSTGVCNQNHSYNYHQENPPLNHGQPTAPPSYEEAVLTLVSPQPVAYVPTTMPY